MNLALVKTAIRGMDTEEDLHRLHAAVNDVKKLISSRKRVLVHLDTEFGGNHLSRATGYSKNVREIQKQIKHTNGLLLISLLRSARVPTHTKPLMDRKSAIVYLKRMKHASVVVY